MGQPGIKRERAFSALNPIRESSVATFWALKVEWGKEMAGKGRRRKTYARLEDGTFWNHLEKGD